MQVCSAGKVTAFVRDSTSGRERFLMRGESIELHLLWTSSRLGTKMARPHSAPLYRHCNSVWNLHCSCCCNHECTWLGSLSTCLQYKYNTSLLLQLTVNYCSGSTLHPTYNCSCQIYEPLRVPFSSAATVRQE